jgi:RNA polymerase sigma factor (sigma-70 family)
MATTPNSAATTLHFVRGLLTSNRPKLTDAELLQAFASKGDEAAFNTLVKRHGPLVLGVCRRVLGPGPDAEDAFQATFLLLVRKARSIRRPSSLAAWLHGTARRIALYLQRTAARRRKREAAATPARYKSPAEELTWREVQAALDDEIARLAEKYRSVFVLCCLEQKSLREAAGCLGLKEGTVGSRLDRARKALRQRLTRRGIDLSALLATVALAEPSAAVALPLVQATVRAGCLIGSGQAAAGAVSAKVLGLVPAGIRGMALGKITLVSLAVVAAGTISTAAGLLWPTGSQPRSPYHDSPPRIVHQDVTAAPTATRTDDHGDPLPQGAVARLGTTRFRHEGEAGSVVFSPDGKILAAQSREGSVFLWEARTGRLLRRIPVIPGAMGIGRLIDFSSDSQLLAAALDANHIGLWQVATGKPLTSLLLPGITMGPLGDGLHTIRFSPNGRFLGVVGDQKAWIFDVKAQRLIHQFKEHWQNILFTSDGERFVTGVHRFSPPRSYDLQVRSVLTGKILLSQPHAPGWDLGFRVLASTRTIRR